MSINYDGWLHPTAATMDLGMIHVTSPQERGRGRKRGLHVDGNTVPRTSTIMSLQSEALDAFVLTCLLIVCVIVLMFCALLSNDVGTDIFLLSNCFCPCYECCVCCDDLEDCTSGQQSHSDDADSQTNTNYQLGKL